MNEFHCDQTPLQGKKLLEASAGTGKTYSLERIVARLIVGDGVKPLRIGEILVVTFTKAATAELTVRIHESLARLADACRDKGLGRCLSSKDDATLIERWMLEGLTSGEIGEAVLAVAEKRLRAALSEYDDAAISTIHGFCQKALERYAFTRGGEYGLTVATDVEIKALRDQVRDECLQRLPMDSSEESKAIREIILGIKDWDLLFASLERETRSDRASIQKLQAESFSGNDAAFIWFKENFALWAIDRLKSLKSEKRFTTFDDMLLDLREAVHSASSAELIAALRREFRAVLIDEFQDTDPVQYDIFWNFFIKSISGDRLDALQTLIFVGDPKQAIYSFRSAEIETYLRARKEIGGDNGENIYALNRNFRSCPVIVDAVNAFFALNAASENLRDPFLMGPNRKSKEAMRVDSEYTNERLPVLFIDKGTGDVCPEPAFEHWRLEQKTLEEEKTDDIELIASDIARLLSGKSYGSSGEEIDGVYGLITRQGTFKALEPSDIAILVKSRNHAPDILKALAKRGIAGSVKSDTSVFVSEAAQDLSRILLALESPDDKKALAQAMVTYLVGANCDELREDAVRSVVRSAFLEARKGFQYRGIYATVCQMMRQTFSMAGGRLFDTEARLLKRADGDRLLSDYFQVLEILQEVQRRLPSIAALRNWLQEQRALAEEKLEKTTERIETDRSLVRIVTIHSSKGLQYPVVYLYGLGKAAVQDYGDSAYRYVYRETDGTKRQLKIACPKCSRLQHRIADPSAPAGNDRMLLPTLLREEQENIRLLYVAMTRAANRLVMPIILGQSVLSKSPIMESLFGEGQIGGLDKKGKYTHGLRNEPSNEEIQAAIEAWRNRLSCARGVASSGKERKPSEWLIESIRACLDTLSADKTLLSALGVGELTLRSGEGEFVFSKDAPQALLNHPGVVRLATVATYSTASSFVFPRRWTRTSFTAISNTLTSEYASVKSDFYGFPAGPEAGTFLHETIEKTIGEGLRRFRKREQNATGQVSFMDWLERFVQMEFDYSLVKKTISTGNEVPYYDPAVLDALDLTGKHTSAVQYARLWVCRMMHDVFSTPLCPDTTETLESLIQTGQVATEVDFLEHTLGDEPWSPQTIAQELSALGIENLSFSAMTDEACRELGEKPSSRSLAGFLTGQIDILMRTGDKEAGTEMYWILDWKSNKIEESEHSRDFAGNYRTENMEAVMNHANYKLQALIYLTALRRYLSARYGSAQDADRHIGGAVYVFLRGVLGASANTAPRHGFYSMPYSIYKAAVLHLDALFSGVRK